MSVSWNLAAAYPLSVVGLVSYQEGPTQEDGPAQREVKKTAKKLTPYFFFLNENRAAVKEELAAAGQPTSIGAIGKALGVKWKALSEQEKQVGGRYSFGTGCVSASPSGQILRS